MPMQAARIRHRRQPKPVRSPQYAEVLDRYMNRLVSLKRVKDALALYRREIDRNPNDPGLYERFAEFLNQNKMAAEIEQVYKRRRSSFRIGPGITSWRDGTCGRSRRPRLTKLTQTYREHVFRIGTGYILPAGGCGRESGRGVYRQVNLYAHRRFPHDQVFVKNLLSAYRAQRHRDPARSLALLRQNWYHDTELRSRFFQHLANRANLDAEIAAVRSASALTLADRAATELIAGAEIWRSHFENAAPVMQSSRRIIRRIRN